MSTVAPLTYWKNSARQQSAGKIEADRCVTFSPSAVELGKKEFALKKTTKKKAHAINNFAQHSSIFEKKKKKPDELSVDITGLKVIASEKQINEARGDEC